MSTKTFARDIPKDERIRGLDMNVYDAAIDRMTRVYKQFDHVLVSFSGGKDSLVCLGICREVLNRLGRHDEPVRFIFRDEEVIQQEVIDNVVHFMNEPGYEGTYYAVPMKGQMFILGESRPYVQWDTAREDNWVRVPPPYAVRQLTAQNMPLRQTEMNPLTVQHLGLKGSVCFVTGIRADESLQRRRAVTSKTVDAFLSGDNTGAANVSLARPIYDWSTADVFKLIYDMKLRYAAVYDMQMWSKQPPRVSTPLHSKSTGALVKLRETYPQFFAQIVSIWPDVLTQERYWQEWDQYGVIQKYPKTWVGVVQLVKDTLKDPRALKAALTRVQGAMTAKQNNVRLSRYGKEENGGCYAYPLLYIFKSIVDGAYSDGIQPKPYPSPAEIEFERQAKAENPKSFI